MDNQSSQQHGFHSIMLFLDRGLQSPALADILAVIRSCPCYVEDMPFPILVNAILLRLSETFQGEKFNPKLEQFLNLVRLNIIKAVREFRHHLHVAFSSDDIVRSIMKVSHSNDFYARSLTLLFLAALAPLVAENAKAHHLIIESLDCSEETELSAAIVASTEFGRHSVTFCALMVGKIGQVLSSGQTAIEVKLRLLNVMGNFRENHNIARTCFRLLEQLLHGSFSRSLHMAALDASTQLAARSGLAEELIVLLLAELGKAIQRRNVALVSCDLRNLARLADFPRQWSTQQVATLRNVFEPLSQMNSHKVLCLWLKCTELLTSIDLHCNLFIEKGSSWMRLLESDDIRLRVTGLRLLLNLMRNSRDQGHLCDIFLATSTRTIVDFHQQRETIQRVTTEMKQFYKSVSIFSRMPQCTSANAISIVQDLTRNCAIDVDGGPASRELFSLVTETLCSICDAQECGLIAATWAMNEFLEFAKIVEKTEKMRVEAKRPRLSNLPSTDDPEIPFPLYDLILMPAATTSVSSANTCANNDVCTVTITENPSPSVVMLSSEQDEHDELIILDSDTDMDVDSKSRSDKNKGDVNNKTPLGGGGPLEEFLHTFERVLAVSDPVSKFEKSSGWIRYKMVRSAFHYGHWYEVALPLLERLQNACDSMETSSWMNALINVAHVQWDNGSKLSVNELNDSYKYLRNAYLIFQRLAATPRHGEHCFAFAAAYISCMALTWQAVRLLLSALNIETQVLEQYMHYSADRSSVPQSCFDHLCESLVSASKKLSAAHAEWMALLQRSFDADSHTLEHIHSWAQFLLILENVLLFLCGEPMKRLSLDEDCRKFGSNVRSVAADALAEAESNVRRSATNCRFHDVLVASKDILDQLGGAMNDSLSKETKPREEKVKAEDPDDAKSYQNELLRQRLTLENLATVKEVLNNLKKVPLSLPRYFFQRIFRTQIKLNVSPTPRDNDGVINIHVSLLPMTVEGVIQSDNAKRIDNVTVIAEFVSTTDSTKSFFEKREICLESGENYFKTQFLLKITEPTTKVSVRLLFTDAATKRTWLDESAGTELVINFHETAKHAASSVSAATAAIPTN